MAEAPTAPTTAVNILKLSPKDARDLLLAHGIRRAYVVWDRRQGRPVASHPLLQPVAQAFAQDSSGDYRQHEGVFLEIGAVTGYLLGAFVLRTVRGAAAGGVRFMRYKTFEAYLHDGLRLAQGMGRKNALSGIWWGGGKGVIAALGPDFQVKSRPFRDALFAEYGSFMSSLHGCYITAEDLGVCVEDVNRVFSKTRYTTCISEHLGGNGNPSVPTGVGIVTGIEAALDFLGRGGVEGKSVAIMGCGNVANSMVERLLELNVGRVVAADTNPEQVARFNARWAGRAVTARVAAPGDYSILYEDVDVVSPCAVGGVLNPETIPRIRARIVCGSANNQLLDDTRDDKLMKQCGIRFCVDFVVNRMGIVTCCNEQYGKLAKDPAIQRHFDRNFTDGIFQVTQRIFALADRRGISEVEAANELADTAAAVPHPIWGHRGQEIIDELVSTHWELQAPLSAKY